eukprot:4006219-Prymnesium_polylepis.1
MYVREVVTCHIRGGGRTSSARAASGVRGFSTSAGGGRPSVCVAASNVLGLGGGRSAAGGGIGGGAARGAASGSETRSMPVSIDSIEKLSLIHISEPTRRS